MIAARIFLSIVILSASFLVLPFYAAFTVYGSLFLPKFLTACACALCAASFAALMGWAGAKVLS